MKSNKKIKWEFNGVVCTPLLWMVANRKDGKSRDIYIQRKEIQKDQKIFMVWYNITIQKSGWQTIFPMNLQAAKWIGDGPDAAFSIHWLEGKNKMK